MRNNKYTSRRAATTAMGSYSRGYNTIRHTPRKKLGPGTQATIVGLLVLIIGLIYVSQGTQATSYDYQLSEIEDEIAELTAKKEDLAVERARLTSISASENSEVAKAMETAEPSGYAE